MGDVTWNTFVYEQGEMKIIVKWWSKDFAAFYKSKYGTMEFYRHFMYNCSFRYTEEQL